MVASTVAQSNTGNGCKIYFAACLAVAQIERCCAVLGRDTSRAMPATNLHAGARESNIHEPKCITNQLATSLSFLHGEQLGYCVLLGVTIS